jgi:class 3 adenylate cyclase
MNRAAAILTKMKRSEQKQIRDDERRILDALRSSGSMSDRTAEETLSRIKLVMAQGRLVLDKVSPRAHKALFSHRALRDRFLASNSACAAFIMSIDIRRSAELMLNARSAELFAEFMAGLCEELKGLICDRFGIVDKFTGDGLLASFPEFFSGPDAGYRAISAAHEAHLFTKRYKQHRSSFFTVLTEIGLGIGIDYGNIRFMRIAGDLTVVGAPVVNAARLSSAPVGKTVLNQQAHERIASHYGAFCSTSERELDIKHQGWVLAHEVKLKKLYFVPSDPPWLDSKEK